MFELTPSFVGLTILISFNISTDGGEKTKKQKRHRRELGWFTRVEGLDLKLKFTEH